MTYVQKEHSENRNKSHPRSTIDMLSSSTVFLLLLGKVSSIVAIPMTTAHADIKSSAATHRSFSNQPYSY